MQSLAYIPTASQYLLVCVDGRESPLVMMPSAPVLLRGVTHPSVKGYDRHPPLLHLRSLTPISTSMTTIKLWVDFRKNLVPMKSGKAGVFESTSKPCQQPIIHCKELVNTITTQFQLFALLTRAWIDLVMLALQNCKNPMSDLCLGDMHRLQEDESC